MKIHHLGYLVENMDSAVKQFLEEGGKLKSRIYDEDRLVEIAFIEMERLPIELVCPHEGSVDVGKSIRRLKTIPYHLCFECRNLEEEINKRVKNGDMLVKEPQKAVAIDNRNVAFMYNESIGLFELVEESENERE